MYSPKFFHYQCLLVPFSPIKQQDYYLSEEDLKLSFCSFVRSLIFVSSFVISIVCNFFLNFRI